MKSGSGKCLGRGKLRVRIVLAQCQVFKEALERFYSFPPQTEILV